MAILLIGRRDNKATLFSQCNDEFVHAGTNAIRCSSAQVHCCERNIISHIHSRSIYRRCHWRGIYHDNSHEAIYLADESPYLKQGDMKKITMNNLCELCGQETNKIVKLNEEYKAYLCPHCDFLFTDTGYEEGQRKKVNQEMYGLEERIYIYFTRIKEFNKKYEDIYWLIMSQKHNSVVNSMLEIGSNIGFFANFIKKKGIAIETVEMNNELRYFQQNVYGITSVESLDTIGSNKKFDVIILMDVLEHIPGPVDFLMKTTEYLSKDGIIFLQFPNKNSLAAKLAGEKWGWWSAPDHLYHFSDLAVSVLARRSGLTIQYLTKASPIVDDLISLPYIGKLLLPLLIINRIIPINNFVHFKQGSIIQVILKKSSVS
jgi:SAM-dependent methyltransferase